MKKKDGKDRYRRKEKPRSKAYYKSKTNLRIIEQLESLMREDQEPFLTDDTRCISNLLLELADKGINLSVIQKAMDDIWKRYFDKTGLYNMEIELPYRKDVFKKLADIRGAVAILVELKPVFEGYPNTEPMNNALRDIQGKLQTIFDDYCEFYLQQSYLSLIIEALYPGIKFKKVPWAISFAELQVIQEIFKPGDLEKIISAYKERMRRRKGSAGSMHGIRGEAIVRIVAELERAGFKSALERYKTTSKILHVHFPGIFSDNWKQVKQIYYHHTQRRRS
jgi:hypothetical protein